MKFPIEKTSIETLTVTVQAIHLNGKQMSLAVFRQLPIQHEDTKEDVTLWGLVRYEIRDQGRLWLVYSSGGKLWRRSIAITVDEHIRGGMAEYEKTLLQRIEANKKINRVGEWINECDIDLEKLEKELQETRDGLSSIRARIVRDNALLQELPQLFVAI